MTVCVVAGQRFSYWTVLDHACLSSPRRYLCKCLCGTVKWVNSNHLRHGHTNSCGCYSRERTIEALSIDLTGNRYGLLVVLKRKGKSCECLCDCGKTKTILKNNLSSGKTISCGCMAYKGPKFAYRSPTVREKSALINHQRRALVRGAGGCFTATQVSALYQAQRGRCAFCRGKLGDSYHRDHVMPLALGGSNDIGNIQLLCVTCNQKKYSKDPIIWAQEQGRLL